MHIVFGVGRSMRMIVTWRNIAPVAMKMITTDVEHLGKNCHVRISECVRNVCY